ncbi:phosphohydrolase [Anaerocolumna cellulosilytica]|uniref:Phosphohydrolase n=1 Tax=Anaerocolumna cellulosilytica TaxID=433286 RepID=A0A6S6QZJ5_9FIRM|nr:HD-GYP domain-containing protein [Anaerocolumna cellulosilytica]MBB5194334.1 putative nucleotidyltransferase with HDIG domain [Anaerocolumna cellulosilytica]BCJ93277.1 phosphohydrolase [Anaerocolumna cellulosilytica]
MSAENDRIYDFIDYHEIIECITGALDAKDPYTGNHSLRVSEMAQRICEMIGLKLHDIEEIHIAAHLHDIGKIGIPDVILHKEGPLTAQEWEIMKRHPKIGSDIISKSKRMLRIGEIVLYHHERYDGKGYPHGICANEIPVGSRIIAICDSIDAMSTKRSYRQELTMEQCYIEIERNLGAMYDPYIGRYVLEHWEELMQVKNRIRAKQ